MIETLILTIATALVGAISTIWGYWTGRKKTASENSIKKAEALHELNETIDLQCQRINDLYELVLSLKSENATLASRNRSLQASVDSLTDEIEALRRELAQYRQPTTKRKTTPRKTTQSTPTETSK